MPRPRLRNVALVVLSLGAAVSTARCDYSYLQSPTAPSTTTPATGATTLTYTNDVQPVLAADCVRCHGPSRRDAGVDLSTYANVMKTVTAGDANSRLIVATRSGGTMYGQFSGNRSQKSTLIRDWIVSSHAAQ